MKEEDERESVCLESGRQRELMPADMFWEHLLRNEEIIIAVGKKKEFFTFELID